MNKVCVCLLCDLYMVCDMHMSMVHVAFTWCVYVVCVCVCCSMCFMCGVYVVCSVYVCGVYVCHVCSYIQGVKWKGMSV